MYTLNQLRASQNVQVKINDKWVISRPLPFYSLLARLKDAWAVLTYKADAFTWPEGQ